MLKNFSPNNAAQYLSLLAHRKDRVCPAWFLNHYVIQEAIDFILLLCFCIA